MPRQKNQYPSERLWLSPWVNMQSEGVTKDPRHQAVYDWYRNSAHGRQAATLALEMLASILNGEMGPQIQQAVKAGDTQAAIDAARDLMSQFVVELGTTPAPSPDPMHDFGDG